MAMNFSPEESILEDITCPICLEILTEPLSLDCGHSFCQACITADKQSVFLVGREFRCPVCQSTYQTWMLRPNWQLASIVEKVRKANTSSNQWQWGDLCEQHGENCHIFCKEDGKAICGHCVQEHQGHEMSLMEEVVKEYQEKLQKALNKVTQEQQEAEKLEADISEERAFWKRTGGYRKDMYQVKNHMQAERERIVKGFEEMRSILDREEQRELLSLEEDEVNVLENLTVAKEQVAQQLQYTRQLTSELQCHMCESSVDTLQDLINVIRRSEIWTLKKPKIVSKKVKSAFRVPDLSGMLQGFKELTEVQSYWVDLMKNPLNPLSNVVGSADPRQVRGGEHCMFGNVYPCNSSAFDVLGGQNFSLRKYYWEVDVSGKIAWILGVYSNLNREKSSGFVFDPNVNHLNVYSRFRPENGYWVVGLQNESEYSAFEDSPSSDPKVLTLFMAVPPHRVGVFLDYEAGTVSFFNVTNHGSLIYKFSKCHFSQSVYPYFNPWKCPAPITLCPPSS